MSKIRDKKRKIAIKRKQKRRGKLRIFRREYLATHDKKKKDDLVAKIFKVSPDFALQLMNVKEVKHEQHA